MHVDYLVLRSDLQARVDGGRVADQYRCGRVYRAEAFCPDLHSIVPRDQRAGVVDPGGIRGEINHLPRGDISDPYLGFDHNRAGGIAHCADNAAGAYGGLREQRPGETQQHERCGERQCGDAGESCASSTHTATSLSRQPNAVEEIVKSGVEADKVRQLAHP